MNKFYLIVFALLITQHSFSQVNAGKATSFTINAKSLQNTGGANPNRKVYVYLTPNYDKGSKRFPVIDYMHGFMGTDSISSQMKTILDRSIAQQKIRPFILVIASHYTLYEGSFYSNS